MLDNSSAISYSYQIHKSNHFDFCDIPQYSSLSSTLGITGEISKVEMKDILNDLTVNYFNLILKEKGSFLAEEFSKNYKNLELIYSNK